MPQYYFDTDSGGVFVEDIEGIDLPDHRAARMEALASLPAIAVNRPVDGGRGDIVTHVRDGAGKLIFVGTLSVTEEWIA